MADISMANVGSKGLGGSQSVSSAVSTHPLDSIRNRESNGSVRGNEQAGAEFKKSLADSIAQATAAQPQEISSTQTAAKVSQALGQIGEADSVLGNLKFSAHAVDRMKSRGISFAPEVMKGIESAVSRAAAKGSKDTLVLTGDNALIVSVKNNTVVTVMDKNAMRDNVFTNIDSTVIA